MNIRISGCLIAAFVGLGVSSASAQESKSAPLAKELVAALDAAKLDSVAAKDPAAPDVFFGALHIPGTQLLVLDGHYSSPMALELRILRREYKDAYLDLQGSSPVATRLMIEDMGANGLLAKRVPNQAFDSIDRAGKRLSFDSNWKAQKIKEEEYLKAHAEADARYAQILTLLIAETKRPK